jgi:hypothetical protein
MNLFFAMYVRSLPLFVTFSFLLQALREGHHIQSKQAFL